MSAHTHGRKMSEYLRHDGKINDVASGGVLPLDCNAGYQVVEMKGTGTKTVDAPSDFAVGSMLLLNYVTDGGTMAVTFAAAVTDTGSEDAVTFTDAGDFALFVVVSATGTKKWRIVNTAADGGVTFS